MENETNAIRDICRPGSPCAWGCPPDGDRVTCSGGDGTCCPPPLMEAEPSNFHDAPLIEATKKINQILREIPADADGRELAFLNTKTGVFLAWVTHGAASSPSEVTAQSDPETIAAVLKLKKSAVL